MWWTNVEAQAHLVVHPADVSSTVASVGPHYAEDRVAGEEGGRGRERLLGARHGVHLEPGVGGEGLAPGHAGQVHSSPLRHPVHTAHSVRLTETVSWALSHNDIANLK